MKKNVQDLKKGGVLNIVRRKVELNCPADNIPSELRVDLLEKILVKVLRFQR